MAISFDVATGSTTNPGTSLTYAHTCTGSNLCLIVSILTQTNSGTDISSVKYNGVLATKLKQLWDGVSTMETLYGMVNPSTGSNNVVISTVANQAIFASSASYKGVLQAGLPDSSNSGTTGASPLTVSTTTVADECWLIGGASGENSNVAAGTGTTLRDGRGTNQEVILDSNGLKTPPGSFSLQITYGGNNEAMCVVSIAPVSLIRRNIIVENSIIKSNTGDGIHPTLVNAVSVSNCSIIKNGAYGVNIPASCSYTRVTNNYFEKNVSANVLDNGTSTIDANNTKIT